MPYNDTYQRKFDASPIFHFLNSQLTGTTIYQYTLAEQIPSSIRYLPLNFATITNNGEDDIYIFPNNDPNYSIIVSKNTIKAIDQSAVEGWFGFSLQSPNGTTISANKVRIDISRTGQTADSVISRMHKKLFGTPDFSRF